VNQIACPVCGAPFVAWRGKAYCSETCRKRAENRRLRGSEPVRGDGTGNETSEPVRGDETAVSSVTDAVLTPSIKHQGESFTLDIRAVDIALRTGTWPTGKLPPWAPPSTSTGMGRTIGGTAVEIT
jgi:hypothetical protein